VVGGRGSHKADPFAAENALQLQRPPVYFWSPLPFPCTYLDDFLRHHLPPLGEVSPGHLLLENPQPTG